MLGISEEDDETKEGPTRARQVGVLWRGTKGSRLLASPDDLRPGDTLVLPVDAGGWETLGHIPEQDPPGTAPARGAAMDDVVDESGPEIDVAEAAFWVARGRAAVRLHPSRFASTLGIPEVKKLLDRVADDDKPTLENLRELMRAAVAVLPDSRSPIRESLNLLVDRDPPLLREDYPARRGIVLTTRRRVESGATAVGIPALDDGEDDASRIGGEQFVSLKRHTDHVVESLGRTAPSSGHSPLQ